MVQVVLEDGRRGDGIEIAPLARAADVAALPPHDVFRFARGQPLVPHGHGQTDDPRGDTREISRAARLWAFRAVGVQRQADHQRFDAFLSYKRSQPVEDGRQAVTTIQHHQRSCQYAQPIAHRHANPPLPGVDAEHPPADHAALQGSLDVDVDPKGAWRPGRRDHHVRRLGEATQARQIRPRILN